MDMGIHGPFNVPGTEKKRLISGSSRNAHTGCFRRWELQNIRGVRRVMDSMAPSIGTLGHKCLAEYYTALHDGRQGTPLMRWDRMLMQWETETLALLRTMERPFTTSDKVQERVYDLRGGLHHWYAVYGERDASEVDVLLVEAPFRVPMAQRWKGGWRVHPMYAFTGKIDLLVYNKAQKQRYLVDHKFTGAADVRIYANDIKTIGNGQRVGYVYAVGDYIVPDGVDGLRYDVIRMKCPSTPTTLQCRSCKGTGTKETKVKLYVDVQEEKKAKRYEEIAKADGTGTKRSLVKDVDGCPVYDVTTITKTVLKKDVDGKQVYDVTQEPCDACNATGVGGISRSNCDTTAMHFMAEVDRMKALNPDITLDGVQEQYEALVGRGDRFVHRFTVGVSRGEVLRWMDDMIEVCQSMTAQYRMFNSGRRLMRNLSACKWANMKCDLLAVCDHDGWDVNPDFKVVPTDPFKPYEAKDEESETEAG